MALYRNGIVAAASWQQAYHHGISAA